jgi:hypothetical protein
MFPVVQRESVFVECPKRGNGQDWDGAHLLELLPKCGILKAARDCQSSWLDIPPTTLALADEVIE